MASSWFPVMTDAGRAAIQAADGLGLSARITHVALGTGRYAIRGADGTPTQIALAATALTTERLRVQCYAGGSVEPGSLLIVAQVPQAANEGDAFWISEIGFFDESGTLLVIWSDLTNSMGQRGTLAPWNLSLSFSWQDMPSGAITVNTVNAAFSDQLLRTARLQAQVQRAAQEAGVTYYADDPMVLSDTIEARVNQAVASLNKVIRKPIPVAPTDGATGQVLTPLLRSSTFFSPDGYTHSKSQFVITNQAGTVLHDSGEVPATVEFTVPAGLLTILTTYRWRVRYKGLLGATPAWSDWSADAGFTTASTIVAVPSVISPANGAINVVAQPTLTSTAFVVQNGSDSHYRSRWQVSASADFSGALTWDSGDVTSLTQVVVPAALLAENTTYHVRVRHIGQLLGPSGWSAPIVFQTKAVFTYVAPPSITAPTNNQVGVSLTPTISLSAFTVVGGADTHSRTQVQVRLATGDWGTPTYDSGELAATVSHVVPVGGGLPVDQNCVLRARFKGQTVGWSAWSNEVAFRTTVPAGLVRYETPGPFSGTVPAGVTSMRVRSYGAGGDGGGDGGGGGGGGGFVEKLYTGLTPGQSYSGVVGGRVSSPSANTRARAGTTTFTCNGVTISATGGESLGERTGMFPSAGYAGQGGLPGTGSGGDINLTGGPGDGGVGNISDVGSVGRKGGNGAGPQGGVGGGGAGWAPDYGLSTAQTGATYGGGGGPAADNGNGGPGAPGAVVIDWGVGI